MRFTSSENPCSPRSAKPIGTRMRAGQKSRPPALPEISCSVKLLQNHGTESQKKIATIGIRKKIAPKRWIHACTRGRRRPWMMSMRTCSLRSSVQPAQSRNTTEKRYHCSSSSAFELRSKSLRTMALPALSRATIRTSQ